VETRECVVCGLVGCWLFRVGAASVEEEDGDASTVVVHPDLGLETVATAALAVGLVGAASPFAPLPEVLEFHRGELPQVEQLAAHQGGEERRGVLGVGEDAAVGGDAPMPVGRVGLLAVRLDPVAMGCGPRIGPCGS